MNRKLVTLNPVVNGTLKADGFLGHLNIEGSYGQPNVWIFLKREDVEELFRASSDILDDNPAPMEEKPVPVANPPRSEHRMVDDAERSRDMNAVLNRKLS